MQPVDFPESNSIRTAPKHMANCSDLHIHRRGDMCVSKWKLSGDELMHVLETGHVWLIVHGKQPPVSIEVRSPYDLEEA